MRPLGTGLSGVADELAAPHANTRLDPAREVAQVQVLRPPSVGVREEHAATGRAPVRFGRCMHRPFGHGVDGRVDARGEVDAGMKIVRIVAAKTARTERVTY